MSSREFVVLQVVIKVTALSDMVWSKPQRYIHDAPKAILSDTPYSRS